MKKIRKRLCAMILALLMMVPMVMTASAQNTQSSVTVGTGTYINPVSSAVWEIEFPTSESVAFQIDPLKLIYRSEADNEESVVNSSATVLFTRYNSEGELDSITSSSGALEVKNKGTSNVAVDLNVRLTDTPMEITTSAVNATPLSADPLIRFGVNKATNKSVDSDGIVSYTWGSTEYIPTVGKNMSENVDKADVWVPVVEDGNVTYALKDDAEESDWNTAAFYVSAEANPKSDGVWEDNLTAPNLQLTWNVRKRNVGVIEIQMPDTSANFTMAADCQYATAGQTVNVYVLPKKADSSGPNGYVISAAPKDLVIAATKNYITGAITDTASPAGDGDKDKICRLSNGIASDNGTTVYSFKVPAEDGIWGFTATKSDKSTANTIKIMTGPTVTALQIQTTPS